MLMLLCQNLPTHGCSEHYMSILMLQHASTAWFLTSEEHIQAAMYQSIKHFCTKLYVCQQATLCIIAPLIKRPPTYGHPLAIHPF
mmetsp:Transcript_2605/g.2877  ORF Transcript_2605/g.2877 Transcript_2605/m.2877 type:complete len:85 (-) Transcript_2605:683-937(-)